MAKLDRFIIDDTTYELVPEIAPLFNPATPYYVNDCVIHDAVLYKFTANHAAGAWTGNDVVAFEVGSELASSIRAGEILRNYLKNNEVDMLWVRGALSSSTGGTTNSNANKRCRTPTWSLANQIVVADISARFTVYFYNGGDSSNNYLGKTDWMTLCKVSEYAATHFPTADRFKLLGSNADDSMIGDGESADVSSVTDYIYVCSSIPKILESIAPIFTRNTSYSVGDCVFYSDRLYKFTANHAAGAWKGNDVEAFEVGSELVRLGSGGSGSGLTEDVKVALLACFEKVAWIDEDGQDYYDALYDALYPPAELVSISAVFTQGSAVIYDTDSLDTLKQYLVVTAHMSDSSTQTVANYVLSGTLTEGTSTITVTYGGKTTTFNVEVTEYVDSRTLLYNWDFKTSLTDSVGGKIATLTNAEQSSSGISFDNVSDRVRLDSILSSGNNRTIEVDVASYNRQGSEHGRFIMPSPSAGSSDNGLIYRKTGKWALYWSGTWTDSSITSASYFDGKTVSLQFVYSGTGTTLSVWCDGTKIVEAASSDKTYSNVYIGSGQGYSAYNLLVTALRVYEVV